jgi:hypothetical protein
MVSKENTLQKVEKKVQYLEETVLCFTGNRIKDCRNNAMIRKRKHYKLKRKCDVLNK